MSGLVPLYRALEAIRTPLEALGKQDFHVLEASGRVVYGYGTDFASRDQALLASADGERRWGRRKAPELLTSLLLKPWARAG